MPTSEIESIMKKKMPNICVYIVHYIYKYIDLEEK